MSLRDAPLLYVFYEMASLPRQQELYERILGLPLIENSFHTPHECRDLVKYDGGQIVLSLNLAKKPCGSKDVSDGLVMVLSVDDEAAVRKQLHQHGYRAPQQAGGLFTDAFGHHYIFRSTTQASARANGASRPAVQELHLMVSDFPSSLAFYRDTLKLEMLDQTKSTARFTTGTVDLLIQHSRAAPDGRAICYRTYLLVFYIDNIFETREMLVQQGVTCYPCVGSGDIGYATRFRDPSGHTYCLYEPSEESLSWGSDPKVMAIMANGNENGYQLSVTKPSLVVTRLVGD